MLGDSALAGKRCVVAAADKTPQVSVIIPIYNQANTLAMAIRSVLAQTFQDFEIIVVDDGSTDDLAGALTPFNDSPMRLLSHDRRRGAAAARNTGVAGALADYVAFLDSDDEWLPTKLAKQLAVMATAPPKAYASTTAFFLHRASRPEPERREIEPNFLLRKHLLWGCNLSPGSTLLARRECFEEIGLFDTSMPRLEDWDWLLRYAARYEMAYLNEPLARVHIVNSPLLAEVEVSVERMRWKHEAKAAEISRSGRRIFRASLLLELSATNYHNSNRLRASILAIRSICWYPFRNVKFFARMFRALLGPVDI